MIGVEARKHAAAVRAAVVTLPRRQAPLPTNTRPAPDVSAYDRLLKKGGA